MAADFLFALAAVPAGAATCLIDVDGVASNDSPCRIIPQRGDRSFRITTLDGRSLAKVGLIEPGVADAWWNEASGSFRAGTALGTLYRDSPTPPAGLTATLPSAPGRSGPQSLGRA